VTTVPLYVTGGTTHSKRAPAKANPIEQCDRDKRLWARLPDGAKSGTDGRSSSAHLLLPTAQSTEPI